MYGLAAIGEKTNAWNYSLLDGTNTPRQLTDIQGGVTLSARYTPWGDTLELHGTGNFAFGYFGGVMDAATGLLYVGNGQYYDPATGRFLTRDARPNNSNPYVPWDPTGAIIGPLGIAALFFSKRKKGSKWGTFLVFLLVVVTVSMTLAACGGGGNGQQQSQPSQIPNGNQTSVDTGPGTNTGGGVSGGGSATQIPTYTCTPTPTATSTPMPTPTSTPTATITPTPTVPSSVTGVYLDSYVDAYNTYVALKTHAGWWNKYQIGNITSVEFLGILISYEFSGDAPKQAGEDLLKQTAVRNFYVLCTGWAGHPCSPDSDADVFIYIAHKKLLEARPGYIVEAGADPNKNPNWNPENQTRGKWDFGGAIRNPTNPEWKRATVDEPFEWANKTMLLPSLQQASLSAPKGNGTRQVFWRSSSTKNKPDPNPMFILTGCQTNYWSQSGQDYDYGVRNCSEPENWIPKPKN